MESSEDGAGVADPPSSASSPPPYSDMFCGSETDTLTNIFCVYVCAIVLRFSGGNNLHAEHGRVPSLYSIKAREAVNDIHKNNSTSSLPLCSSYPLFHQ